MSPSLMFLSLPLSQMVSERGFCHQLFPPKTKANAKWGEGQRGRILEGKGWGLKGEGKREASGQYTRTRANFKAKHPKGGEKERREQNYWGTTFFLFLFLLFSFLFFWVGESSKARFLRDCATIRVSQVRSGQVRQEEEQGEQGEQSGKGEREREAGVVCTCAHVSVCVCVCTKLDLGRRKICCVCVYVQRGPSPTPQVNVGFFARNYYRLFFFKLLMCILIL